MGIFFKNIFLEYWKCGWAYWRRLDKLFRASLVLHFSRTWECPPCWSDQDHRCYHHHHHNFNFNCHNHNHHHHLGMPIPTMMVTCCCCCCCCIVGLVLVAFFLCCIFLGCLFSLLYLSWLPFSFVVFLLVAFILGCLFSLSLMSLLYLMLWWWKCIGNWYPGRLEAMTRRAYPTSVLVAFF